MDWQLNGTTHQNALTDAAIRRCTFPFSEVAPRIIPVDWQDLSRYNMLESAEGHHHVHMNGDIGHPVEARNRVLGLAWYSGRVTLDVSLSNDPELAAEVFLSEGAHMLDFFWFEDTHRMAVWNALHPDAEDLPLDTNVEDGTVIGGTEGWFDVGPYRSWVGEAWMGLFVRAYSDVPVTIPFDRPPHDEAVAYVRSQLTPWFSTRSGIVHDQHRGQKPVAWHAALPADRRLCRVCKPTA